MFPWGLSYKCPCTCREPQPTFASPRDLPLPLGWSLELLWVLWGPLRRWPSPIPACACSQISQLPELDCFHLWECSLSTQISHRHRVYLADHRDLICSLCSWWKDFRSSSLVTLSLGFSSGFTLTFACGPPTGACSWGCPRALGSAPVRTGHRGGMTAWIVGAPGVPNAMGTRDMAPVRAFSCAWYKAHEGQPWLGFFWCLATGVQGPALRGLFLLLGGQHPRVSPERASLLSIGRWSVWGERGYNRGSSPCLWLSSSVLLPQQSSLLP